MIIMKTSLLSREENPDTALTLHVLWWEDTSSLAHSTLVLPLIQLRGSPVMTVGASGQLRVANNLELVSCLLGVSIRT